MPLPFSQKRGHLRDGHGCWDTSVTQKAAVSPREAPGCTGWPPVLTPALAGQPSTAATARLSLVPDQPGTVHKFFLLSVPQFPHLGYKVGGHP